MTLRIKKLMTVILVVEWLAAGSVMALPNQDEKAGVVVLRATSLFVGHIVAIAPDVGQITVQQDGNPITMNFVLSLATRIQWNKKYIPLTELLVGDPVRIHYVSNSDVSRVDVLRPKPRMKSAEVIPWVTDA